MPPVINEDVLVLSVKVKGTGDYLPEYAGNLDIINCAAIEVTKKINDAKDNHN
jgi:acetaldehyde dehydrogenase